MNNNSSTPLVDSLNIRHWVEQGKKFCWFEDLERALEHKLTSLVLYHPATDELSVYEFDLIKRTRRWATGWKTLEDRLEDGCIVVGRFDEEIK